MLLLFAGSGFIVVKLLYVFWQNFVNVVGQFLVILQFVGIIVSIKYLHPTSPQASNTGVSWVTQPKCMRLRA